VAGNSTKRTVFLAIAALLSIGLRCAAQIHVGEETQLNLNGSLSGGYSGSYGDALPSGHGFIFGGNADLSGSYHDPNFLSFHINPYLNQSHQNSSFQSITDTSGIGASANIFGGSHFPGWINFNRNYNSTGTYAVPGLPDYVAHGDSQSLGVGWSESMPDWPSISVGYQQGASDYSVYGTDTQSTLKYRSFNTSVADTLKGFRVNGDLHYGFGNSRFPQINADQPAQIFNSDNTSYSLGVSHLLPTDGTASVHFNQSDYDFNSRTSKDSGSVKSLDGFVNLNPTSKLTLDANTYYTNNLVGALIETIVNAGGAIETTTPSASSSSFSVMGDAVYSVNESLRLIGRADHRQQMFNHGSYGSNSYGGVVTYFHFFLGGRFNATQTVMRTTLDYSHESSLGLVSSVGYARSIGKWNTAGTFNYSQNQQTLLVTYSSSGYNYGATLGRKLGWKTYWNLGANGSKSLYNNQAGSGYFNQTYTMALTMNRIGASAAYSKSNGTGLLTPVGVVPTPIPTPGLPSLVFYGGESYSYSLGGSPVRRLTFTASYVRALTRTTGADETSTNRNEITSVYMQYAFRKLSLNAGYTRLMQGFSASAVPPATANSFYIGISRWFNFF
jgi:hypothetical protein